MALGSVHVNWQRSAQFASDLDEATRKQQLEHGQRVTELMKQNAIRSTKRCGNGCEHCSLLNEAITSKDVEVAEEL